MQRDANLKYLLLVAVVAFAVVLLGLSSVGTAGEPISVTLIFEQEAVDLDTGSVVTIDGVDTKGDIHIAYHADRTPHAVVVQNTTAGAELAFLNDTVFDTVTATDVVSLPFTTAIVDEPFESNDTVVIRTSTGAVFKLGNPIEDGQTRL